MPFTATTEIKVQNFHLRSYFRSNHRRKASAIRPFTRLWKVNERKKALPTTCSTICPREPGASPRVFAISDLHTDYVENMAWVRGLSTERFRGDVLLVAGDVAETYHTFVTTMSALKERFARVFFVPGNHDLWCRMEGDRYPDSLEKLSALLDACGDLGVETDPAIVNGGLGIIPLYSWYHESFDKEKDINDRHIPPLQMVWKDFHACRWPRESFVKDTFLARLFDMINEKNTDAVMDILQGSCQTITFSHYIPRQELCPEKRMLFYPKLPKIIGSDFLEARIRSIHYAGGYKVSCHVCGHAHHYWDAVLDGIRYVQAPLGYPRERKKRLKGMDDRLPLCIYSAGKIPAPLYWES